MLDQIKLEYVGGGQHRVAPPCATNSPMLSMQRGSSPKGPKATKIPSGGTRTMAAEALTRHGMVQSMDFALLMNFLSAATDEVDELLTAIRAAAKEAAERTASNQ